MLHQVIYVMNLWYECDCFISIFYNNLKQILKVIIHYIVLFVALFKELSSWMKNKVKEITHEHG